MAYRIFCSFSLMGNESLTFSTKSAIGVPFKVFFRFERGFFLEVRNVLLYKMRAVSDLDRGAAEISFARPVERAGGDS